MNGGHVIKRLIGLAIAVVSFVAAVVGIYFSLNEINSSPRTDVAEISAPTIHVSPTVPGRIVSIAVQNNASVKKGDVLFQIDPQPYQLRLDQAQAELRAAQSEVEQGGRNIATAQSNADVAAKQIERARFNAELARQTLERLEPLLPKGYVTAQQVDQARTAYSDAQVSLDQALQQSQGATQVIGTLDTRKAQVDVAEATVALAQRDLDNTTVRAPFDGKVTGLEMAPGEYVITAQSIFTLIDTSGWEAVAFFRETELDAIRLGSRADVFVMADRSRRIQGEVESIGWGVRSGESANILGLPIVSSSLNWVKVAKRFPVYVKLHEPPADLMRIGSTAIVIVGQPPSETDAVSTAH